MIECSYSMFLKREVVVFQIDMRCFYGWAEGKKIDMLSSKGPSKSTLGPLAIAALSHMKDAPLALYQPSSNNPSWYGDNF